jgi:saccharopine dehydrogenase (NAD+, L-lysine-forming)
MIWKLKIGVLKETKIPPDRRVAITPFQAKEILRKFPDIELFVQRSEKRCYRDDEYSNCGVSLTNDLSDCDILIGIKEVAIPALITGKTYLFFSHTAKRQSHNRSLLQEIVKKGITLIDYEFLTDKNNLRLVAFGRWAGIVGAYNGLLAWGKRFGTYELKPAHQCYGLEEMLAQLLLVKLPDIKILITGGGRVAGGALETFARLNIKQVSPEGFLNRTFNEPVFCRIDPWHYARRKDGSRFDLDTYEHFISYPEEYESSFYPYTKVTDLFFSCHYWDPRSPVFMTEEDMRDDDFRIQVIADVSCDIKGSVPSTIRSSTITDPFYGYDPFTGEEADPFNKKNITVMAVDNLPGELPRDTSTEFGKILIDKVYPSLFGEDTEDIIAGATIVKNGKLTKRFIYLQDFIEGKEL